MKSEERLILLMQLAVFTVLPRPFTDQRAQVVVHQGTVGLVWSKRRA